MSAPGHKRARSLLRPIAVLLALAAPAVVAQPVDLPLLPATTTTFPAGITVAKTPAGPVYVDAKGHTLYGLDLRTLLRWGANVALYCKDKCAEWQPLLAPPGAAITIAYPQGFGDRLRESIASGNPPPQRAPAAAGDAGPGGMFRDPLKAPDWTVIAGPAGPQWVYKGWHMVYVRKGDGRASTKFDGAENLTWNTLKFVPPTPQIEAPAGVRPLLWDGSYVLADKDGHALYVGACPAPCLEWKPFAGGMASAGMGAWKISNLGDRPQWTFRDQPVFVSQESDPGRVPRQGQVLKP